MGGVAVEASARWRNDLGQFVSRLEGASDRSIGEVSRDGARLAAVLAPRRTDRLAASIHTLPGGGFGTGALAYALAQEKGSRPHPIGRPGQVLVNREQGFGPVRGPVMHPGTKGQHFLLRAFRSVFPTLLPKIKAKL